MDWNLRYLSKLKPHKMHIDKSAVSEVKIWVCWTYKWICVRKIKANSYLGCMEIESIHSFLQLNKKKTRVRYLLGYGYPSKQLDRYVDRRFNSVVTRQKIWMTCETGVSIIHKKLKFDEIQNEYLSHTLVF